MTEIKKINSRLYKETVELFRKRPADKTIEYLANKLSVEKSWLYTFDNDKNEPKVVNLEKLFIELGGKFSDLEE